MLVGDGEAYGFGDNSYRIEGKDDGANARIGFVTGGSEKMRIDSSGNVGIGISPSHPLHITKEIAGYQAYFNNDNGSAQGIKVRVKANDSGNFNMLELVSASSGSDVTAMVVRDDGNVGISTSNPQKTLDVQGTFAISNNANSYWDFDRDDSDGSLKIADTGTERMRIDASGRVSIGRSSNVTAKCLELQPPAQISDFGSYILNIGGDEADDAVGTKSGIGFGYTSTARPAAPATIGYETKSTSGGTYGDLYFATRATYGTEQPTERMRIDSSGNLLVGTSTSVSASKLTVSGATMVLHDSSGSVLRFQKTLGTNTAFIANRSYGFHDGNGLAVATTDSNPIRFATNDTDRMRIDSSGNLLVGNTVANPASGFSTQRGFGYANSTGKVEIATTANDAVMEIGKNNANDGSLIAFRKQGTSVGSIGTEGGRLQIGKGASGLYFYDSGPSIIPWNIGSNSTADNYIDLGSSGNRFKDLYLSGGVQNITASGVATGTIISAISGVTNGFQISANASNQMTYDFNTGAGLAMRLDNSGNLTGTMINATNGEYDGNLDDLKKTGFYRSKNSNTNNPSYAYYSVVVYGNQGNVTAQIATLLAGPATYVRSFNTSWTSWVRIDD